MKITKCKQTEQQSKLIIEQNSLPPNQLISNPSYLEGSLEVLEDFLMGGDSLVSPVSNPELLLSRET